MITKKFCHFLIYMMTLFSDTCEHSFQYNSMLSQAASTYIQTGQSICRSICKFIKAGPEIP